MKQFIHIISLWVLFLCGSSVYALELPDGTEALVSAITEENGRIAIVTLLDPTVFTTTVGTLELTAVAFYESGVLKAGILSKPHIINQGKTQLKIHNEITFYESGLVQSVFLSDPQVIAMAGSYFRIQHDMYFYESGSPFSLSFASPHIITTNTTALSFANTVYFYENGSLGSGVCAEPQNIETSVGTMLIDGAAFYENATMLVAQLHEVQFIETSEGLLLVKGEVNFYQNGMVQLVHIAENSIIQDTEYTEDSYLFFSETGQFLGEPQWQEQ